MYIYYFNRYEDGYVKYSIYMFNLTKSNELIARYYKLSIHLLDETSNNSVYCLVVRIRLKLADKLQIESLQEV